MCHARSRFGEKHSLAQSLLKPTEYNLFYYTVEPRTKCLPEEVCFRSATMRGDGQNPKVYRSRNSQGEDQTR